MDKRKLLLLFAFVRNTILCLPMALPDPVQSMPTETQDRLLSMAERLANQLDAANMDQIFERMALMQEHIVRLESTVHLQTMAISALQKNFDEGSRSIKDEVDDIRQRLAGNPTDANANQEKFIRKVTVSGTGSSSAGPTKDTLCVKEPTSLALDMLKSDGQQRIKQLEEDVNDVVEKIDASRVGWYSAGSPNNQSITLDRALHAAQERLSGVSGDLRKLEKFWQGAVTNISTSIPLQIQVSLDQDFENKIVSVLSKATPTPDQLLFGEIGANLTIALKATFQNATKELIDTVMTNQLQNRRHNNKTVENIDAEEKSRQQFGDFEDLKTKLDEVIRWVSHLNETLEGRGEEVRNYRREVNNLSENTAADATVFKGRLKEFLHIFDSCKQVEILGTSFQSSRAGKYFLHGGWCLTTKGEPRPIYKHAVNKEFLFFNAKHDYWMVGPVPCKDWGGIHGISDVDRPEKEAEKWKEHGSGAWKITDVKVHCEQP